MSKGRRYNRDRMNNKLNIKKVIAVIIALLVIIMFVIAIVNMLKKDKKLPEKNIAMAYYTVYENEKWGVINSRGETVISPSFDEMIVIPNKEKNVFITTSDVDYKNETYKSQAINDKKDALFTNYDRVEAIQNQDEQNSVWYASNCLKVMKDGQYGLIDLSGKVLLECQYDEIIPLLNIKNTLITIKDNKKGLVSTTGTILINNEYEDISSLTDQYEDGYIVKNSEGKYGVIGTNKKIVVPIQYDSIINSKSEDTYIVNKSNQIVIYNSKDNTETNINVDEVKSINGGNVVVKKSDKYGIVDLVGNEVIEAKYQDLQYAFSNFYIAKLNEKYGIIDSEGTTKLDFEYDKLIYRKTAGFIEAEKTGDINSYLINTNFEIKLTGIISEININKGYIKIRTGSEYKYYNFKFEEKKNTELLTGNTLFLSKKDNKYGYVNKNGVVVVNYVYDDATEQNDSGYVAVKKDGKWGALNQNGEAVVEPTLELENNPIIDFIGTWHLCEDINAGYYTK